jgi:hypothetical protein
MPTARLVTICLNSSDESATAGDEGSRAGSSALYLYPIATTNQTMALAAVGAARVSMESGQAYYNGEAGLGFRLQRG